MAINLNNKRAPDGSTEITVVPQVYTTRIEITLEPRTPGGTVMEEVIYKAEALTSAAALVTTAGQVNSASIWRITKTMIDDGYISILYPNGDPSFAYAYSNRANLTYR
jgi:hypothetical protein